MFLGVKLGDLEGKLGHRKKNVETKWCNVEAIGQILHPEMLAPQQDQDIERVSASYVCPIWGQVRLPYGYVGAILGPTSTILGPTSAIFGLC